MSYVDALYAVGVLVAVSGSVVIGWVIGRRKVETLREQVQAIAQLALAHGATPAQLERRIGARATARLCWPADTVTIPRVADPPARPPARPRPSRIRNDAPRFAGGHQAVGSNGRQEAAAMEETRVMDARDLRRRLDGGGRS